MDVIYEPRGKAREYSELALNLMNGCLHGCKYCYCPNIRRMSLNEWSANPTPRKDVLKHLERQAKKMQNCDKEVLFSFMHDPYQNEEAAELTRSALLILEKAGFKKVQVLTKAGVNAVVDFPILERNGWKFGSTICFMSESMREEWEPGAPSIQSRIDAIKKAHDLGVYTWVSIEPVFDPEEALSVIRELKPIVSFFKIGKLNHFKEIESKIDWKQFLFDVEAELGDHPHYIKVDLEKYR